jgi:hypothetical protein
MGVNPARLAELQHQRSLVREQLAWLDREIAKEGVVENVVTNVATAPTSHVETSAKVITEFDTYAPDPVSAAAQTRRGCFMALAVAVLLIIAAFTAIYLLKYRNRPLFFASPEETAPAVPPRAK